MNTLHPLGVSTVDVRGQVMARAGRDDFWPWLSHVASAAGCTRPIRLAGTINHVDASTGRILEQRRTADLPDGVLYKACGNRRESVCPSCARTYQRDAYQLVRAGLVGGKGVPETIAIHPTLFITLTAPSFGAVHTRPVPKHTCAKRRQCDCRPRPCHPGRDTECVHGRPAVCFARHERDDQRLGEPMCLDCYDYHRQAVWNNQAGELWRRTTLAITRTVRRTAKRRGIGPATVKVSYGKVAEMQRRAVVHFHAVIRLDGTTPDNPAVILPPPDGLGLGDLVDAVEHAATTVIFATDPHPVHPAGWVIAWGEQLDVRTINLGTDGAITDGMVAGYLAKYASKATEATGHTPAGSRPRRSTCTPTRTAPTPNGSSTPAGPSAARPNGGPCVGGRTCSASAATSSPRAATTPSPSGSYAKPARYGSAPSQPPAPSEQHRPNSRPCSSSTSSTSSAPAGSPTVTPSSPTPAPRWPVSDAKLRGMPSLKPWTDDGTTVKPALHALVL
jgi:hypothetical protein